MKEINIYRVRRDFNDVKSQKGAFLLFEAAVKVAEKNRLGVFDGSGNLLYCAKRVTKTAKTRQSILHIFKIIKKKILGFVKKFRITQN